MKYFCTFLALVFVSFATQAQTTPDTTKKTPPVMKEWPKGQQVFSAVEQVPVYPGGTAAFSNYISRTLKYPEVARLIGIDGRLMMRFIVEPDGKVSNVSPVNCIGAGCEAEAVRVLQESKAWSPGIQDGKPVRVQFVVPISFIVDKGKVNMKDLRASNYGFVFNIKDKLYTIDEAQDILGKSFLSEQVQIAEPFYNANNDAKYLMPSKKEVYIVKMKAQ
nr:energy transducer TonB [uncultured Mucilaginibacter sp.]